MKNIILLNEQGFCYGVSRAIDIAKDAASTYQNIYLLGSIVHNKHVEDELNSLGIITLKEGTRLEMLDNVPDNSVVIFSAHGVSDDVYKKAESKKITIIDATCPYVKATFEKLKTYINDGYDIFFIGKSNHPEVEAALSISSKVHFVDAKHPSIIKLDNSKIIIANQTTMSKYDIEHIAKEIINVNPTANLFDMICKVTEKRQNELKNVENLNLNGKALILVVGDITSNNSTKLYELAKRITKYDSIFIDDLNNIDQNYIKQYDNIIIASGTSTPIEIINEIKENIK